MTNSVSYNYIDNMDIVVFAFKLFIYSVYVNNLSKFLV